MNATDIPLPQDTQLYQASNNQILEPRLAVTKISGSGNNNAFSSFSVNQYKFNLYNQNTIGINLFINDKSVSCTRGPIYYNLNGFDYGFEYRFLNYQSPTICFAPEVQATDLDTNVTLTSTSTPNTYTISDYTSVLSNSLVVNSLFFLRNQTSNSQNKIYRVLSINGNTITVYDDSNDSFSGTGLASINVILNQNQDYIFTRVKVADLSGEYYYGLYNTGGFFWAPQTLGLQLPTADYGISFNNELPANNLNYSIFSAQNLSPSLNEVIAINVLTNGAGSLGGKTSGLYLITKITNGKVYFQPIYPSTIFIQQFFKVKWDLDLVSANQVWYVNPDTTMGNNYLYSTVNFSFSKLNINSTISENPSSWALQTGGANDTVIGFTVLPNDVNNNYIKQSDSFSIAIKPPTWTSGSVEGLLLNANYTTNILPVNQEVA